jgi:hypothetical protein
MEDSTKKTGIVIILLGLLGYFYFKNKKAVTTDITTITDAITTKPISNEPTQVFGTKLPDGTTATGVSSIAPNPVDVVPTALPPVVAIAPIALPTVAPIVLVDNSGEAIKISKQIFTKIGSIPTYRTKGSLQAINKDVYAMTQKMLDLGYAPTGAGGAVRISKINESNAPAIVISKAILAKINSIPNYKTAGTLNAINKDIQNMTTQIFNLGYVPDLKGGIYKIISY